MGGEAAGDRGADAGDGELAERHLPGPAGEQGEAHRDHRGECDVGKRAGAGAAEQRRRQHDDHDGEGDHAPARPGDFRQAAQLQRYGAALRGGAEAGDTGVAGPTDAATPPHQQRDEQHGQDHGGRQ